MPAMMNATSSQESFELFSAPARKGGYQQVDLTGDQETEMCGSGQNDLKIDGHSSEAKKGKN